MTVENEVHYRLVAKWIGWAGRTGLTELDPILFPISNHEVAKSQWESTLILSISIKEKNFPYGTSRNSVNFMPLP
ncbi:4314_t:CDS:1, partial [Acaulospora colombiana]